MKTYLIFEDGTTFTGESFASVGNVVGNAVFTTEVVGFCETLCDPCYEGQILIQTFPEIGCAGINLSDASFKPALAAYVINTPCEYPSSFRCEKTLEEFLTENGIVGMKNADTRAITKYITTHGVQKARLVTDPSVFPSAEQKKKIASPPYIAAGKGNLYKVACIDFGRGTDVVSPLERRNCEVTVFGADFSAEKVIDGYDGVVLSDGYGRADKAVLKKINSLAGKIPLFGIGFGHLALAESFGAKVVTLSHGHHGSVPVKSVSGKVYVNPQNHLFAVNKEKLPKIMKISHLNVNDGSIEGLEYPSLKAFSVQFRPGDSLALDDGRSIYDKFVALMKE